jgi:hypothetical protein
MSSPGALGLVRLSMSAAVKFGAAEPLVPPSRSTLRSASLLHSRHDHQASSSLMRRVSCTTLWSTACVLWQPGSFCYPATP